MTPAIQTVLGPVAPENFGVCYAHEHIIIDDSYAARKFPAFRLDSVDRAVEELERFHAAGGRAMVDSMPCGAGRNVIKLAEISRRTGIHILCPTGLHLPIYYPPDHWSLEEDADRLAERFIADIEEGIDRFDENGPEVDRTSHRAGLIKIATGDTITPRDKRVFEAAATAHKQTGAPILTHTEQGRLGLNQIQLLSNGGVDLRHVVLSHTDRFSDLAYHREMLSTGVCLEYDSAFRWKDREKDDNPTLDLVLALAAEFPGQIFLGMDAARSAYWQSYGGTPGLSFLLDTFSTQLADAGLKGEQWNEIFVTGPAAAYCFRPTS